MRVSIFRRITSYNVCYTKLLRAVRAAPPEDAAIAVLDHSLIAGLEPRVVERRARFL